MNILVTGGAGFIGSHLVDHLILDKSNHIIVIDNLLLGKKENIQHHLNNQRFEFYENDLLNYKEIEVIFRKSNIDLIFHLVANSDISRSHDNPDIDYENTFLSTYNILKLMKQFDVKNIVFSSTSAIYGESKNTLKEDFGPLFPISHYGASKLSCEAFISSFVENYGLKSWIVRFPNVVGERATHGIIFDLINKLKKNTIELEVLGDGEQFKPYLYVKDLIEAIIFILKNSNKKINYFNVGVESRTKVKNIAKMVLEEMDVEAEIKYTGGDRGWIGDIPEFNYNLDKIHKLGWKAKYSSDESVRKAIRNILGKE